MDTRRLVHVVRDHFREHAAEYALAADGVEATYVLNWGGFVNHSYRITDGRRSYHLKLGGDDEQRASLAQWYRLRDRVAHYHAPPVVGWVDVGAEAGLLFEVVPGAVPTLSAAVVDALVPVLAALHADASLGAELGSGEPRAARESYLASFHERFTEDLRGIGEAPPPFVGPSLVQWMHDEAGRLRRAIESHEAFDEPLATPVHGDLWLNNIHWVDAREWYLLDWDTLGIGDPAADLAALLGPSASDLRPLKLMEHATAALTPAQRARLPLLGRATLLDWVIDPLSDWIDAHVSVAHVDAVRAEKARVHRGALASYRALYG
jgi:aminoglycoside phosphotransferase (APT) family kinase protein